MVAVALPAERQCGEKKSKWFIHQAGAYQKDPDLRETPFFSPSIAKYCNSTRRECGFVSWGQQAHVPTCFKSSVLYFTRYKDCGGGLLEVV